MFMVKCIRSSSIEYFNIYKRYQTNCLYIRSTHRCTVCMHIC